MQSFVLSRRPRRTLLFILGALAVPAFSFAQTSTAKKMARADVFQPTKIWQVHLTIPAKEWTALQPKQGFMIPGLTPATAKPIPKEGGGTREVHRNSFGVDLAWAEGDVTIEGESFKGAGVRYKGNGTIGDAARTVKKSLKIDLGRSSGAKSFRGLKSINLHSGVADPSKLRETLSYGLYRAAGVPAPRTTLAEVRLTVPGKYDKELLGLYTIVEHVDKAFLRDFFKDADGLVMKPENLRDFLFKGNEWKSYKTEFAAKREPTADEAKRIIEFSKLVHRGTDDEFRKSIRDYLDVDAFLRYLAATSFVSNSDSFFTLGHNYMIYLHPKTGKLHFMPWDLDRALANFPILGSRDQQMDLSFRRPYAGPHRLTDRIFEIPGLSDRYQKVLAELAKTAFARDRVLREYASLEAAVKDARQRSADAATARKEPNGGGNYMFGVPPPVDRFLERRVASLDRQAHGKSPGFEPNAKVPAGFNLPPLMAGPLLDWMDLDADERISRDEWTKMVNRLTSASKLDADGKLNTRAINNAINSLMPKGPDQGAPPGFSLGGLLAGPIMRKADAKKVGKITPAELSAFADRLFAEFDRDKRGQIDESQFLDLLTSIFQTPSIFGGGPPAKK